MQKITLPISEYDLEEFENIVRGGRHEMTWQFPTDKGEEIEITFVKSRDDDE